MPINYSSMNRAQLNQVRQLESFKPGVAVQLVALFDTNTQKQLGVFRAAADASDFDAMRRAAHSLKGVAASLGASGLSELAAQIETDAGNNDTAAPAMAIELEKAVKAALDGLNAWLLES